LDPTERQAAQQRLVDELAALAEDANFGGRPEPIQAGPRWPVGRTHSWLNDYGKLRPAPTSAGRRRVVTLRCRRVHRDSLVDQPGLQPLPPAHLTHHPQLR
jgi:hypothetical protein